MDPDELAASPRRWQPIDAPMPAAAALRSLGDWSLDGAPRNFDDTDWWYRLVFDAPLPGPGDRAVIGFDGLATLATVWLNGRQLLASDNMFRAHECDVTDALRPSGNELLIRCASLEAALSQRRPRPRWRTPMVAHQQLRWLRTTLLGRTPGWSPPAAVAGPWRDIWLETRGAHQPTGLRLEASLQGTQGVVSCRIDVTHAEGIEAELRLERGGRSHVQRLAATGAQTLSGDLLIDDVEPWWPHTHGEPALYDVTLELRVPGRPPDVMRGALGFRTIELDTTGGAFHVRVNGVPVFCRGACWMPLDPVSLRSTADQCRAALAQVRAAGMNMVRVPGTTVYEEGHFYRACDEMGVLVWQDFMFASMDYPAQDEGFLRSVTEEATQQLRRLRSHPCLAVLCGNSEVAQQAAMWGAPRELWTAPLFDSVLAELCRAEAPHTPYWPSSAHGGAMPQQADQGTTSYYGVGAYLRPLEDARRAGLKFATECLAFANVPSQAALSRLPGGLSVRAHHPQWKARSPRDLGAGWDFDDVRDHYLRALFRVDPQALRSVDHERYLALSRMVTGEAMAAAFSEWRRPASDCGGALVLALRDLWAGAGWGVLDEAGVPKACWHALKRVLQPVTVLLTDEGGNGLFIHALNELPREQQVRIELAAWRDGEVEVASGARALTLPPHGALTLPAQELLDYFMDLTYAYRFGPPPCDTVAVTLRSASGDLIARAFHFPAGRHCEPRGDLGLQAVLSVAGNGAAELTVSTRRLAFGVHFDIPGFEADDEYFHLAPGTEVRVVLRGQAEFSSGAGSVHAINATAAVPIQVAACQERRDAV